MTVKPWLRTLRSLFVRVAVLGALLPIVWGAAEVRRLDHIAWVDEQDRLGREYTERLLRASGRAASRGESGHEHFHRVHHLSR